MHIITNHILLNILKFVFVKIGKFMTKKHL